MVEVANWVLWALAGVALLPLVANWILLLPEAVRNTVNGYMIGFRASWAISFPKRGNHQA